MNRMNQNIGKNKKQKKLENTTHLSMRWYFFDVIYFIRKILSCEVCNFL